MQVEQIDRDAAINAVDAIVEDGFVVGCSVMSAVEGHEFASYIAQAFARHRHQGRAEVVGEIVADLKTLVDERDRLKLPKSTTAIIRQCAARVEANFGGRDGGSI